MWYDVGSLVKPPSVFKICLQNTSSRVGLVDDLKQQSCSKAQLPIDFSWSLDVRIANLRTTPSLLWAVFVANLRQNAKHTFASCFLYEPVSLYCCDNELVYLGKKSLTPSNGFKSSILPFISALFLFCLTISVLVRSLKIPKGVQEQGNVHLIWVISAGLLLREQWNTAWKQL